MRSLVEAVGYVNLALFTLLALLTLLQWHAGRGRASLWAALTFATLAIVADVGRIVPEDDSSTVVDVAIRVLIALLVLFPYLLYRFTTAFQRPTRRLERLVGLITIAVLVWTFLLPALPEEGEPQPLSFDLYVAAFLFHWTLLTVVVAVRLWRAGRGQPSVARRRMRLLASAAVAITVAILLSAAESTEDSWLALAVGLLATISALAFLLGLAPPGPVRMLWRRPEQDQMRTAVSGLMAAHTEADVAAQLLPPVARMMGARAAALRGDDGRWIGSHGATEEMLAEVEEAPGSAQNVLTIDIPTAEMVLWTTPYAPFFGSDELRLLRGVGNLTGLALDRSRLFAHEREMRIALERADEIKTNFVALAAHELRTPVASVKGIVDTLHARGGQIDEEVREQLEAALRSQSDRMAVLVEQLLDLSRLDADAVPIHPQPLAIRQRVEELVTSAAGGRREAVRIDVPPDLAALVDPTAFDRIVSNLVVNALRYGAAPVIVSAERSDNHFRLAVEDRGTGVPSEFVPDLFERFTRSEESRQRAGGSGLGLAIARSYAHAHRGDLIYERAEPHGARFQLVLPAE